MATIVDQHGKPIERSAPARRDLVAVTVRRQRDIRAGFDAAGSSTEMLNYWAAADAYDADSAHSKSVRAKLVQRSRYEVGNNGFADGMTQTYANYLVGTGPALRMQTPDSGFNAMVELAWFAWTKAVHFRRKLWCMGHAKTQDGEAFGIVRNNPLLRDPTGLDVVLIETEQCQTPRLPYNVPGYIDGIRFDEFGNPLWYDVLPHHPGGQFGFVTGQPEQIPADFVLHWFTLRRPGQHRGIPEFRSTLNVGGAARRWREATLAAAETAADFAALMKTQMAPDGTADLVQPLSTVELDKRMMVALPMGWDASQLKAEHPNATYESFHRSQVNEQARPKSIPYNLAACDSSSYNYASGRLDHQTFFGALDVEREDANDLVLDPTFEKWWRVAVLVYGWDADAQVLPPHSWDWPKHPVADVESEANSDDTKLKNGSATLSQVYSESGQDFSDVLPQMAADYGVPEDEMRSILLKANFPTQMQQPQEQAVPEKKTRIAAAAKDFPAIRFDGDVELMAAAGDGERKGPRSFNVKAYTGGALQLNGWDLPVVVDLAGLTFSKSITANLHHDTMQIVGHVTDRSKENGGLDLAGVVSGTGPAAQEFSANHDNGFPWQASIEARSSKTVLVPEGKAVNVNGQDFTGPLYVARKSKLHGIAFLPRGADENTSVRIAASSKKDSGMAFDAWIEAMGFDPAELSDTQRGALQKKFDGEVQAAPKQDDAPALPEFDVDEIKAAHAELVADIEAKLAEHEDDVRDKKKLAEIKAGGFKAAKDLKAKAIKERWVAGRFEVEAIRAASKLELDLVKATAPVGPSIHASHRDIEADVIEAALCLALKFPKAEEQYSEETLEAADKNFKNIGLQQVLIMAAAANGYVCRPGERIHNGNLRTILQHAFPPAIMASNFSTLSLPGVFSNVANKELLQGYMEEDQTWREISVAKSVNDFKEVTSYRMLDNMEYEELGPAGEIKHGKLGEESFTRKAKTYAKMFSLTREDIINDDLGAFEDLRTRLGRGSSQKFNNLFWSKFLDNAAFFTSGRGNYITGATTNLGLDGVGLELGITAFRQLRSPTADGRKRIGGRPVLLLVPPELEFISARLFQSTQVNTGGAATATSVPNDNIHAGKYRPVVSNWLSDSTFTGYSSTAWYLFRAVTDMAAVVVSFLFGNQTPTVESADADFDTLGVQFRGYHDFGVDLAEPFAGVKSKGAA